MKLVREPLVHFIVLGGLLFVVYGWMNRDAPDDKAPAAVRITDAEVTWLRETWSRQWRREPTQAELRGLVTDYLKEELLAREGRAMRLDENDTIVRRRLAQKVAFLVEDTARLREPSERDLQLFYEAHGELFQTDKRVSFTHVFFSSGKHAHAETEAKSALAQLDRGANPATLGDPLLIESEMSEADERTIAAQFGPDFAQAVLSFKPGVWNGPVVSGYGQHLVRVSKVTPGMKREFAEVRDKVLERWRDDQEREYSARYFAGLMKKYDVVLDDNIKELVGPLDTPLPTRRPARIW